MDWSEFKRPQWLGLGIVFLITVLFLASYPYQFGLTDQVERYRVQQEMLQTGSIPSYESAYGTPIANTYPPLLDVVGAGIQSVGFSFEQTNDFIALILVGIVYYFLFKLLKLSFGDWASASGAMLGTLAVPVFRQLLHPIAGSAGYALLAAMVYYTFRKKFGHVAILAFILSLTHLRTLGVFAVFFTAWCAWELYQKRLDWKRALLPYAGMALGLLLWFGSRPAGWVLESVRNPWVSQPNPLIFFSALGLLALLGIIAHAMQHVKEKSQWWDWSISCMAAIAIAYALSDPINSMRTLFYAFVPMAFLAAYFLQPMVAEKRFQWLAVAVVALSVLVMAQNTFVQESNASYYNDERLQFFQDLKSVPGSVVASDHMAGYLAAALSEKTVVAGPFLESVSDGTERATESFEFFKSCKPDRAFLEKYSVDLIVFTDFVERKTGCTLEKFDSEGKYLVVLERGQNVAVRVS